MAENLDDEASYIEKHVIIGEMSPYLPAVKEEILNYYDNEFESTPFSVQINKEPLLEECESRHFQPLCSGLTNNGNSQNMLLNCNKIILGSKPNRVSSDEENLEQSAKIYQENNDVSIDENYFEELVTSYEPSVVLHDIQSYLHKSKRFCDYCSILFPEPNGYENHVQIFHSEKCSTGMSRNESLTERRQHKCTICAKLFVAPHVLRRHLMNIHKFNNANVIENTTKGTSAEVIEETTKKTNGKIIENITKEVNAALNENTVKKTNANVIENTVKEACATGFENTTKETKAKVIENTIKETNTPKINHASSDLSNTCFHCKKSFDTQKSLIEHLYDILQMKRKNTEIVPVLKSILFKCNKCDIHFTSSLLAANHTEHMEMLINWKCTICNRIFKKEDELSHERQHSVSNNYLTYNLGDLDVANILFRCSKCATHFTESNFLYHYRDCGLEVTKTVTCKICNILLDHNLKTLHEFDKHTESKPFTIIQCDVISDNPVKSTVNKPQTRDKLKELLKSFREVNIVLEKMDSNKIDRLTKSGPSEELPEVFQDNEASGKLWRTRLRKSSHTSQKYKLLHGLNKIRPANIADHSVRQRRNLTYSYCRNCKCFITKFKKAAHFQGSCKKLAKKACTCEHCGLILNRASIMTHRRLHMERQDLKVSNFRFFNLFNGRSMNPPIPEYPKCTHCAVHFVTKLIRDNHICSEVAYQTCHLCEIKLSPAAFKLHMTFHQYATNRKKKDTVKNSSATTLTKEKCVIGENITNSTQKYTELTHNPVDVDETELTGNLSQEYKMNDKTKPDVSVVENKKIPVNIADHLALRRRNMIFSYCKTCKCFITKFQKSAHAQGRCKKMAKFACTCEHCGLILNGASIVTHRRLHEEKKGLKVKNFRFFNLYTGQTMNPPIPEYPNCSHCAVHFLTKPARNNHICSEVAYKTCNLCEIKLSEAAFYLHVTFHQYASDPKKTVILKNLQTATTLDVAKRDAHENVSDSTENERELPNNPLDVAETELTGNMSAEYKMNDKTKPDVSVVENKKRPVNIADHLPLRRRNMIFSYCKTCKCFITKFQKSAHAQGRCKKMAKFACTCEHCGLILNGASIVTHRRLHEEKKGLKVKNFRFFNLYTGQTMNPPIPEYPNCSHCAVHFLTKPARNNHICSEVAYKTCNICEIKLSEAAFYLHVTFHQYASDHKKTVILKNLQTATTLDIAKRDAHENVSDTTENERELPNNPLDVAETELTGNMSAEYKRNDKTKLDASLVENKKRPVNIADHLALRRRNMIYSYCKTCKCFITKFKKSAHAQGRCKKMAKTACTCEHCGLILNDASIVTHRRLHEEKKDLKLKNFRFFNLYTGRTMNPPIPEYPNCSHCAVQFLTKSAGNNHICSEVAYKPCNICEIKLSEAAFELHMTFHQYATDRKKIVKIKNSQAATTLHVAKRVAHENVSDTTENERELPNNPLDVTETELTGKISQEYKMNDETKLVASLVKNKKIPVNIVDHLALRRRNMIYSYCKTCKCFITKFKKSAHAQGRCKKMAKTACTCEHCGLILNDASIVTHRRLHEEKKDLKLKSFRFFNLYTGRTMNPPIPEYPNCSHCAVHFLTKPARNNHICSEVAYKTCNICEIKLSEAAFKLHMTFHQYATDRKKIVKTKNLQAATTSHVVKRVAHENVSDTTENERELPNNPLDVTETELTGKISQEYKINDETKLDASLVENKKRPVKTKNLQAATTLHVAKRVAHENVSDTTENERELPNNTLDVTETELTGKISQEYKMNDDTKLDASLVENKKIPVNIVDHLALRRRNMIYSYCKTCKCFITKFKKSAHAQGRCKKMAKTACTCEHCGLILNDVSIVTHIRLHEEKKDLKLKNFRFFNLYTGRTTNPPIPEYPNCSHCAVHFLTKPARNNHICSEVAYKTCNICEIKLSEAAFKLHMTFHQYATDRKKIVKTKNSQAATTSHVAKRVAHENVSDTTENGRELPNNPLDVTETELTGKISQEYKINDETKLDASLVENKKRPVKTKNLQAATTLHVAKRVAHEIVSDTTENERELPNNPLDVTETERTGSQEYKINDETKLDASLVENKKSPVKTKNLQAATTYVAKRVAHENFIDTTEDEKELPNNLLDVAEIKLTAIRKHKNININLYNGCSTNPPIQDYPKCDLCAVHFLTEKARNNHVCNAEAGQTCHVCEIKLSEAAFKLHTTFHQYATDRINTVKSKSSNSATTLELEKYVTDGNATNSTESYMETIHNQHNATETKQTGNMSQEYKMNNKTKLDASLDENKKRPVNNADHLALGRRNMIYSYCETCKCFITKFRKDAHIQGRCKKLAIIACTCEHCGLILNDASIVTHRRLHEEKTDLKLKNFRFFNLYTGRSMNPPVPEYPKCTTCAVHFLTKKAKNNHICSQQAYQACSRCEIKLSQAAFKLHMNFHQYATDRINSVTTENSQSETTSDIEKRVTNEDVSNGTENYIKPMRTPLDLAETKLTADTNQEYKMNDKNEQDTLQVVNKKILVNITDHLTLRRRNVTYSYCETCKCFVTKFSKATHVQGRCKVLAKFACTCELCGLILSDASVVAHRRLHEERKDLKLKHFRFFNLYTGRSMNPPIPEYPKCTQCAVQFLTKTARNNHICSEQSYQTCHLCESKLSEAAFKIHMRFHQYPKDRCKGVTTMNSESTTTLDNEKRLTGENVTTTDNDKKLKINPLNLAETRPTEIKTCRNTSRQYKTYSGRKLDAFQAVNNKRLNVKYSFCETCKCFITNFKKDAHVQGRCRNMVKIACTCEQCGLVLNSASIVTHRRLHEQITDLKLKNFRFFNLYTGRTMNPPIPDYPKCTHCAVHFLTKIARKDHVCSKDAYQTCHLCEIKLTEAAFQLHMSFHQYATEHIKKVIVKNSKSAMTMDIEKPVTNEDECKTTENETELVRNPLVVAETDVQSSSEIYEIVYTCGNCSVSVDTYDKVVEHCQRHYENKEQETQTKVCNYCELTIDAACYTDHQNLHEKEKELKLLKFDSYYLPADNNMWVKHIFKTLPKEKVLDVLRSSIYRFECRMKMDVIQQGDPNLTVYKCDQCSCFIEPSSLFKHSDNSCFKLRHHPCTVCGIPFNSSASRIDHEKIHNCPGITMDSYRIVVFNRDRDKQMNRSFCLRKNYVLFQCRNCGVIINKLQGDIHTCDVSHVKKCPQCALLLHSKDFEKHVNTHKEFVSFHYSNMKIIILGEVNYVKYHNEITLRSNFKGAIYDYKMYICNKCAICVKNEKCMSNHICRYGKQRLKCLKCDLYFSVGRLKTHTRSHEQDPDFVRSNMNLVSFDPCTLDKNKNTTIVCSKDGELSDSNTDSDTEILAADDTSIGNAMETIGMTPEILEEETVKIYKCTCELHFLNEDSIIRHFGVCRSTTTISKQKCSKCDLQFTPNVLFTHMLAHHSRNICYKYDVIEMDYTQKDMQL